MSVHIIVKYLNYTAFFLFFIRLFKGLFKWSGTNIPVSFLLFSLLFEKHLVFSTTDVMCPQNFQCVYDNFLDSSRLIPFQVANVIHLFRIFRHFLGSLIKIGPLGKPIGDSLNLFLLYFSSCFLYGFSSYVIRECNTIIYACTIRESKRNKLGQFYLNWAIECPIIRVNNKILLWWPLLTYSHAITWE